MISGALLGRRCSSVALLLLVATPASAAEVHVDGSAAPGGDGSATRPFTDLHQGIDALAAPGDALVVHAGTYDVTSSLQVRDLHGAAAAPITIRAEGTVVLDGGDRDRGVWQGVIDVRSSSWIVIRGFTIEDAGFFGIYFEGADGCVAEDNATNRTNGSGIAAWNSTDLTVRRNDVQSCCHSGQMGTGTGCQECVSLDHVYGFLIEDNVVHDSQQQGLAHWGGGEGIDVKNGSSDGVVRGNEVHHVCQLGIYVDAWETDISNVEIYGNHVHHNANGIILTSEQTGDFGDIRVHDNLIHDNGFDGISVSHYDVSNPTVQRVRIYNNTSVHNGWPDSGAKPYFLPEDQRNAAWGRGLVVGDPDVAELLIRDNLLYDNAAGQLELADGLAGAVIARNLIGPTANGGATGDDAIVTGAPGFVDLAGRDLRLAAGSPAIDQGLGGADLGATDFWGNVRVAGSAVDVGAFEYGSTPATDGGLAPDGAAGPDAAGPAGPDGAQGADANPGGGGGSGGGGGCGCRLAGAARPPVGAPIAHLAALLLALRLRAARTARIGRAPRRPRSARRPSRPSRRRSRAPARSPRGSRRRPRGGGSPRRALPGGGRRCGSSR